MNIRVLGELEVEVGGVRRDITSPRQRCILTFLAIHAGELISADRLLESVWGDDVPASGRSAVAYHISKLRDHLDPKRSSGTSNWISTLDDGYRLGVPLDQIDLHRFQSIVQAARRETDPARVIDHVGEALSLWRGEPFAGAQYEEFTQLESVRLKELRLQAMELMADSYLSQGRPPEALDLLSGLLERHPYRESLALLSARAHYQANRQAKALEIIEAARRALRDDLGLSLGSDLAGLEQAILVQSPELRPPSARPPGSVRLPLPADELIGRAGEINKILRLLEDVRLVTLTGLGGIGKSRLAIEIARRAEPSYAGTWFVELARVRSGEQVIAAVAETLDIRDLDSDPVYSIVSALSDKNALLVLDNCEHVLPAAASLVSTLVARCPNMRFLPTSRVAFGVPRETIFPVGPLKSDRAADEVGAPPAEQLFIARANAVGAELPDEDRLVSDIVLRCGGIPLALELAAARLRVLTPLELRDALMKRSDLIASNSEAIPERQSALSTIIEWAYRDASEVAKALWRRLGAFRGGFYLDGAVAMAPEADYQSVLEALDQLVSQSLVVRRPDIEGRSRFMLLEPVRDHAAVMLGAAGEQELAVSLHTAHFEQVMAEAYPALLGSSQHTVLSVLDPDVDNLRTALDRLGERNPPEGLAIASRFWRYCHLRGLAHEGIARLAPLMGADGSELRDRILGLYGLGVLRSTTGDIFAAEKCLLTCQIEAAQIGDHALLANATTALSGVRYLQGDVDASVDLLRESLKAIRRADEPIDECFTMCKLAYALLDIGAIEEACALVSEGQATCSADAPYVRAEWLLAEAEIGLARGDLEAARKQYRDTLGIADSEGFPDQSAWASYGLGRILLLEGDHQEALDVLIASAGAFEEVGETEGEALCRTHVAIALALTGGHSAAETALRGLHELAERSWRPGVALITEALAIASAESGNTQLSARCLGAASRIRKRTHSVTPLYLGDYVDAADRTARFDLGTATFKRRFDEGASSGEVPETSSCSKPIP